MSYASLPLPYWVLPTRATGRWCRTLFTLILCFTGVAASEGYSQLASREPQRRYFGIGRSIPIHVDIPDRPSPKEPGTDAALTAAAEPALDAGGEPAIDLYRWGQRSPYATASVVKGGVDLAALFPQLWAEKAPVVYFAQLRVGTAEVGSPLVLTPLITPQRAVLYNAKLNQGWFINPKTGIPSFDALKDCELEFLNPPNAVNYAGVRIDPAQIVIFKTSLGAITFLPRWDQAPNTCANIIELVRTGFYNEIPVHRIVNKLPTGHPFVVQFGDPTGSGNGGPGFNIQMENSKLPHDFGVLSMARDDDPDTNGSQVFICLSREGTARLDGKYTSFAQAISGADVIMALSAVKADPKTQRPIGPMPMVVSARLEPAPAFSKWPAPVVRPAPSGR